MFSGGFDFSLQVTSWRGLLSFDHSLISVLQFHMPTQDHMPRLDGPSADAETLNPKPLNPQTPKP